MPGERKNFSLIELLVVIGIIALLAALLLPSLKKAKNMALSAQCKNNQRQCGVALTGYASDFDDWVIGGESGNVVYSNLATMMMGLGYAPQGNYPVDLWPGPYCIPFGNVFQCPSLPPPANYTQYGIVFPYKGLNSAIGNSFGLRRLAWYLYFPGEKLGGPLDNAGHIIQPLVKLSSLYRPSILPYMVDTVSYSMLPPPQTGVAGPNQSGCWYIENNTYGGGMPAGLLHLRHNKHANAWCPDGHVASLAAADTADIKLGTNGTESSTVAGYNY